MRRALSLSLVLPLSAALPLAPGCSSKSTPKVGREGPRQGALERAFYERAAQGNWYVVGGSMFQQVARGFPTWAMPKQAEPAAGKLRISQSQHFHSLAISPDGQRFAAMTHALGGPFEDAHLLIYDHAFVVQYEDRRETHVGQKGVNTRSELRWSPDGKLLAYAQAGSVWVIDPTVGGRRAVADDHQVELTFSPPCWIGDSTLVYENFRSELTRLELADGSKHELADGRFPSCSPDASKIAFRKDGGEVFAYELGSGKERELFGLSSHHPAYLWTPDSGYLLVAQRVHNSWKSNYFAYAFDEGQLFDLNVASETLDGRSIAVLPTWMQERLVELELALE